MTVNKHQKATRVMAIESSCDDTSLAIVTMRWGFFSVEKMVSWSQLAIHKKRWWVVPELAARSHLEKIQPLLDELDTDWERIDCIAVTAYPWLPSALAVGVTAWYTLWAIYDKPVIDVHHIMGHVFSVLLERSIDDLVLPYCVLTVSGWHNDVYYVDHIDNIDTESLAPDAKDDQITHKQWHNNLWSTSKIGHYGVKKISQTADDAAWEVFDKIARMLWWPYPWGKWIGDQAEKINQAMRQPQTPWFQDRLTQPRLTVENQFSLSGLKSQVWNLVEKLKKQHGKGDDAILPDRIRNQVAYDFQETITQGLSENFADLIAEYAPKTLWLVGWVSANLRLRDHITKTVWKEVLLPKKFVYCTDNAAMIWVVGALQYRAIWL